MQISRLLKVIVLNLAVVSLLMLTIALVVYSFPNFTVAAIVAGAVITGLASIATIGGGAWILLVEDKRTATPLLSNLLVGLTLIAVGAYCVFRAFAVWQEYREPFMRLFTSIM